MSAVITGTLVECDELYMVVINYNGRQYVYDKAFKTREIAGERLIETLQHVNSHRDNLSKMLEIIIDHFLLYKTTTSYKFTYQFIPKGYSYYTIRKI